MVCPFLKETSVRYCQSAPVRKLIPTAWTGACQDMCATPEFVTCQQYQEQAGFEPAAACPHLRESLMQYCGAAPVARFVPWSEALVSRCGNGSHRYCELYLGLAHPDVSGAEVDGLPMPEWLSYSANHMWLDVTDDGACHIGIDAFLSRALGAVDRVQYVWTKGRRRATAVLSVAGFEFQVVFPNDVILDNCNLYLRADPSKLTTEPYTGGWLFEGTLAPETRASMLEGQPARAWMQAEQRRMNEFLQQHVSSELGPLACDGGLFAAGAALELDREHLLALFHEFFSPFAGVKE